MNTRFSKSRPGGRALAFGLALALAALACSLPGLGRQVTPPQSAMAPGPRVSIHAPANGTEARTGDSLTFFASASDPLGVIRLDLWVDDALVLSQSAPDANGLNPLSLAYPLVAAKAGTYTLTARAFNSQGDMGESVVHYVTVVDPVASTQEYAQYIVQEGDTLENIAARLGVSVEEILRANPHIAGGQVKPGQVIVIPMPKQPAQAAVPGPNGVQPVSVNPGGGQPGGGQPGGGGQNPPPQRPAPVPPNPSPQIAVQSVSISPNPVYYGANCQAEPTIVSVAAKVEPTASVSKVILAYSFVTAAGARSQDIEIQMQLAGTEYKADVNVGGEAEAQLAQAGGTLDLRVEAHDKDGKLSTSPIYTVDVQFCAGAPPPVNQPSLTIKNVTAPSEIYYGQACTTEPLTANVVATIDPPNAVQTATLKYAYTSKAGTSGALAVQMVAIGGSDFDATFSTGTEAEQKLAQDGGWITVWVEVLDTNNNKSISQASMLTVNFCPPQQAGGAGNLPGILPQFAPGAIPPQQAGIGQVEPAVFPMPGAVLPPNFGAVKEPGDLKAVSTEGCKITLTWTDNASDETGYEIHRLDPGQLHYALVAQLKPDTSTYENLTPSPGKYIYYVVAYRSLNGVTSSGGSYNAVVDVTLATNCELETGPKRLMFQPISFNSPDFPKAYVLLTLGSFSPIRVPRGSQDYLPAGDWSAAGEWAIPLPEGVFWSPGDLLTVETRGTGFSPDGPTNLGGFQHSHTYESLADPGARSTNWSGTDPLARYELIYRLWLDNWRWGGAVSDPTIPAPTNLKLDTSDPFGHLLDWDYDAQAKPRIDGFIVYQKQSCPGGIYDSHYVVVKNTGGSSADQLFRVEKHRQFVGCACQYQVSAFTRAGESKLSAPTTEKCETGAPQANVIVTFNTYKMSQSPNRPGDINLFAGESSRASATMVLEGGREYNLQDLYFDGIRNNNRIIVPVTADPSAPSAEYMVTPSAMVSAGICHLNTAVVKFPAAAAVYGGTRLFQLTGSCGANCTCEINGIVEAVPAGQNAPGGAPAGMVWKNIGESCASDSECVSSYCKAGFCTVSLKGLQGAVCYANDQCVSGACRCYFTHRNDFPDVVCPGIPTPNVSGVCVGPSNTDIANGGKCSSNDVCASGYCANGLCAPQDGFGQTGDYCHHNKQCSNHYCVCPNGYDGDFCKGYQWFTEKDGQHGTCGEWPGAQDGAVCMVDNDCQSRHCAENKCAPIDGTGLYGEYCHHDNHCASNTCTCLGGFQMGMDFFGVPSCTGWETYTPESHGTCNP